LPFADFSVFSLEEYGNPRQLPILSSRGCPCPCVFCSTKLFWNKYRSMSGERIIQEIRYQLGKHKQVNFFTFNDHTVNANMKSFSRFVDLALEMKKESGNLAEFSWKGAAVIREEMDGELIKKMKASGCIEIEFGIESASDKVRRAMRKPPDDVQVVERVIRDTAQAGIGVRANFMFGFPGESEEDFEQTVDFLKRNKDFFVQVHPSETFCCIDPGTYLFNHPEEFGITHRHPLFWEADAGKNIYPERLKRHQLFCEAANALNIPLSPGGHKIILHKEHFLGEYERYKKESK
jgi:anaerobic magnesium-protoporphyrin IX monomethyl ester cyclase